MMDACEVVTKEVEDRERCRLMGDGEVAREKDVNCEGSEEVGFVAERG